MHEYRDYSTYLFTAISGFARDGSPIKKNADLDGDNKISFYEAHLYALLSAESYDLSRSTSEMYLEKWTPWYLRWTTFIDRGNNVYYDIATKLADKNGLIVDGKIKRSEIAKKRKELYNELKDRKAESKSLKEEVEKYQKVIRLGIKEKWPEILEPYTYDFFTVIDLELPDILNFIKSHSEYQKLVNTQKKIEMNEQDIVDIRRRITTLEKIDRMRKIGIILNSFQNNANNFQKKEYNQLLRCEKQSF